MLATAALSISKYSRSLCKYIKFTLREVYAVLSPLGVDFVVRDVIGVWLKHKAGNRFSSLL